MKKINFYRLKSHFYSLYRDGFAFWPVNEHWTKSSKNKTIKRLLFSHRAPNKTNLLGPYDRTNSNCSVTENRTKLICSASADRTYTKSSSIIYCCQSPDIILALSSKQRPYKREAIAFMEAPWIASTYVFAMSNSSAVVAVTFMSPWAPCDSILAFPLILMPPLSQKMKPHQTWPYTIRDVNDQEQFVAACYKKNPYQSLLWILK